MPHATTKIEAGHYVYRGHHIYNNKDAEGPNGTRPYWGISDPEDEHSAHPQNPHLNTLYACRKWLDAWIDGDRREATKIANENWAAGYEAE